jgi:hypothetical protein
VEDPGAYLIRFVSRKLATVDAFNAKLTFRGKSPLAAAIFKAFNLAVTIPTRLPY